jgi:nicotinamidase-related amidase
MAIWDDVLTERDKQVFAKAGYGRRQGLGRRPALLIIDMNYNFTGEGPEPILTAIERSRQSCGEEAWKAIPAIQRLLKLCRDQQLPIVYTTAEWYTTPLIQGRRATKSERAPEDHEENHLKGTEIVAALEPKTGEVVIRKQKASAFFGTPLMSLLNELRVDTILVTGCTTSGCVRATVVDAFSYNLNVGVVEEAVFDRGEISHKVNLFDMNAKYADVISLAEAEAYLAEIVK